MNIVCIDSVTGWNVGSSRYSCLFQNFQTCPGIHFVSNSVASGVLPLG